MYPKCPNCGKQIKKALCKNIEKTRLVWDNKEKTWEEEDVGGSMKILCPHCKHDITEGVYVMGMYTWIPKYIKK